MSDNEQDKMLEEIEEFKEKLRKSEAEGMVPPDNLVFAIKQFENQCVDLGAKIVIVTEILPNDSCQDNPYNELEWSAPRSTCIAFQRLVRKTYFFTENGQLF